LKEAQIVIDRRDEIELYLALNKGGVFKLFREGKLIVSDTQFSVQVREGKKIKNAVGHLIDKYKVKVDNDAISIEGSLGWAKHKQMTPFNLIILRLVMLTFGRFFPNLIRKLLQKMLITGKQDAPFSFVRQFEWENNSWRVRDELRAQSWSDVKSVDIGCDRTSIYVVMSRTFQVGQLQPSLDLTDKVRQLSSQEYLKLERHF
jgi:hypothetical protein